MTTTGGGLPPDLERALVRWRVAKVAYERAFTRAQGDGEWGTQLAAATQAVIEAEHELYRVSGKYVP